MGQEIEAKFCGFEVDGLRARLVAAGYACVRPWSLMRRYTYHLALMEKDGIDKWARVRDEGDRVTMAIKQVSDRTRIDGTEEIEFTVSDLHAAVAFMAKLGFEVSGYQENYRETWVKDGVEVTFNQWPALPVFAEVETASEEAVMRASAELGFDYTEAVFGGVDRLYGLFSPLTVEEACHTRELTFAREAEFMAREKAA